MASLRVLEKRGARDPSHDRAKLTLPRASRGGLRMQLPFFLIRKLSHDEEQAEHDDPHGIEEMPVEGGHADGVFGGLALVNAAVGFDGDVDERNHAPDDVGRVEEDQEEDQPVKVEATGAEVLVSFE